MRINGREVVVALLALAVSPLASFAQQAGRTYRLGWFATVPRAEQAKTEPYSIAFEQRLRELGFVEGRNLVIEFRSNEGKLEKLPEIAAEFAKLNLDVLCCPTTEPALVAFKQATRDTPIVAVAVDFDPHVAGHIASLARPGGRITGMTHMQTDLPAKRVELLKELLPSARRIAVLADSTTTDQLASAQVGAKHVGLELQVLEFKRQPYDYESAFAKAVHAKADALLSLGTANFVPARRRITELALKHRLPSMFHHSVWVQFGGLVSYGASFASTWRRAAEQVGMILNGRNPADIPVEQPTKFELVINLKTAKALGITIPPLFLFQADEVIK
jgi:putative tryptophan/tyrosine transport system substrate-binding protein